AAATCGAEAEVPVNESLLDPPKPDGATNSGFIRPSAVGPREEYGASERAIAFVSAPTVTTAGWSAGDPSDPLGTGRLMPTPRSGDPTKITSRRRGAAELPPTTRAA